MSWITVIWSMIASACLTSGGVYFVVWWKNRTAHRTIVEAHGGRLGAENKGCRGAAFHLTLPIAAEAAAT